MVSQNKKVEKLNEIKKRVLYRLGTTTTPKPQRGKRTTYQTGERWHALLYLFFPFSHRRFYVIRRGSLVMLPAGAAGTRGNGKTNKRSQSSTDFSPTIPIPFAFCSVPAILPLGFLSAGSLFPSRTHQFSHHPATVTRLFGQLA